MSKARVSSARTPEAACGTMGPIILGTTPLAPVAEAAARKSGGTKRKPPGAAPKPSADGANAPAAPPTPPEPDPVLAAIAAFEEAEAVYQEAVTENMAVYSRIPVQYRIPPQIYAAFSRNPDGSLSPILAGEHDEIDAVLNQMLAAYRAWAPKMEEHFAPAIEEQRRRSHSALNEVREGVRAYLTAVGAFDAMDRVEQTQAARVAAAERVGSTVPTTLEGLAAYARYVRGRIERHSALASEPLPQAEVWPLLTLETAARRLAARDGDRALPAPAFVSTATIVPNAVYDDAFDDAW